MITLMEIVKDFAIEEERDTRHKQAIFLHHAINAVRDLHYDISGVIKTVALNVDVSKNICNLPNDFMREIGVAVIDASGNLVNLSHSPHIIFKIDDNCGNTTGGVPNSSGIDDVGFYYNTQAEHFRNGQNIGNWFGIGGQQAAGDYTINHAEKRIEFSSRTSQTYIVLKYLSEASQVNGQFEVHEYLREPIKNYIDWKDKERKRYVSAGEKQELHRKYVVSKTWARMRLSSFDVEEAKEIAKVNFTQAPKF